MGHLKSQRLEAIHSEKTFRPKLQAQHVTRIQRCVVFGLGSRAIFWGAGAFGAFCFRCEAGHSYGLKLCREGSPEVCPACQEERLTKEIQAGGAAGGGEAPNTSEFQGTF